MLTALFLVLGLLGLFFGGDWLVKGASGIAERYRVPPFVIGLTIVGFGTSTPELLVSLQAALAGSPGIAIGNVLGSNIANILLILGGAAAIGPISARLTELRRDLAFMLGAAFLLVPLFWNGWVGRIEGSVLFGGILIYIIGALRGAAGTMAVPEIAGPPLGRSILFTVLGLAAVLVGARLLVDSASEIARTFGVSEAVIGLTVVAVGTSLPELATTVMAAIRGEREIALGNVIGSNVFNVLAILGITALVAPIPIESRLLTTDLPLMLATSLLLVLLIRFRHGLGRVEGAAFLAAYAIYTFTMLA